MHKAKAHIARAADRLRGMERKRFLLASAVVVGFTLIVISATVILVSVLQTPHVSTSGTNVVISGQVACLPHKDASGPHTLECALGLHSDDNRYYALKDAPASINDSVGKRLEVHGSLSTTNNSIYDIAGTITVTTIKQ
jgi:hypothetical protein